MKKITAILNALTEIINASETTATTTTTTKATVNIDGKPTTTTSTTTATTTATTTTRTRITKPEAQKQPAIITSLVPAVGWVNPFEDPLKLRDEPYKLITSDFRKEVSNGTTYFMMTVIREYPDGRQERQQREGNTLRDFKKNLEGWLNSLKDDIVLRGWEHQLFADNFTRRWWYYITTENINDPEVQQLMRWFNHKIGEINRFAEAVERRLQYVREEVQKDLADKNSDDEFVIANIAADLDEVRAERDNLREENASLEANLDEAERDLETAQTDLAEAKETFNDLNKTIAALRYEVSCSHAREIKSSERINNLEEENKSLSANLAEAEADITRLESELTDANDELESIKEDLTETEELHTARVDEAARLKCQLTEAHKREEEMSARIADIESALFEICEALGCSDNVVYTNAEPLIQVINKHLGIE